MTKTVTDLTKIDVVNTKEVANWVSSSTYTYDLDPLFRLRSSAILILKPSQCNSPYVTIMEEDKRKPLNTSMSIIYETNLRGFSGVSHCDELVHTSFLALRMPIIF